MSIIENIFHPHFIESLGWTILHSVWQGGALAIILAFAWIILQKNSSKLRYFIATTALFTLFLASLFTFLSFYSQEAEVSAMSELSSGESMVLISSLENAPQNAWEANWASFERYFSQHLPLIVSIWFMGVIVLMLRFLGGLGYLQRLKYYKTRAVSEHWKGTLRYLSTQVGLSRSVELLESTLVKAPMVVGYLKPVILLPLGTLTGLSSTQVESILAHELAHIRRHDYLVNLIQSLVEITLFFNPFAWWISNLVREERENCCDDIAVQVTGDYLTFVKTLTTLEAMRLDAPELAMAFGRKKSGLIQRVQRLLYHKNQSSTFSEGLVSGCVLIFCLVVASYNAQADYQLAKASFSLLNPTENGANIQVNPMASRPVLEYSENLSSKEGSFSKNELSALEDTIRFGKDYMIISDQEGNIQIFKGGKLIPESEYSSYQEDFTIEDSQVRVMPKALESQGLAINIDKKQRAQNSTKNSTWVITGPEGAELEIADFPEPLNPSNPILFSPKNGYVFMQGYKNKDKSKSGKGQQIYRFDLDNDFDFDFDDDHIIIQGAGKNSIIINGKKYEPGSEEWEEYHEKVIEEVNEMMKSRAFDMKRYQEIQEKYRKKYSESYRKALEQYPEQMEERRERMERSREEVEKRRERMERNREEVEKRREKMERSREEVEERREEVEERRERLEKAREKQREKIQDLKKALIKDGLIKEKDSKFTLKIEDQRIFVNGKALKGQEYDKYKKLIDKYLDFDFEDISHSFHYTIKE